MSYPAGFDPLWDTIRAPRFGRRSRGAKRRDRQERRRHAKLIHGFTVPPSVGTPEAGVRRASRQYTPRTNAIAVAWQSVHVRYAEAREANLRREAELRKQLEPLKKKSSGRPNVPRR